MRAADQAIRVSIAAACLGVAGIVPYVSYWHAFESAHTARVGSLPGWSPPTIDGLDFDGGAVRGPLSTSALARWLLALGILATLAANVARG